MPIKVQDSLPAVEQMENENIFVMTETVACHQDIRPLKIGVVNLMPTKITTETQLIRLMSNSPLQVDLDFIKMRSHNSKNTSVKHLDKFYVTFDEIKSQKYDGLIITGAPVETLAFEDVDYWEELCQIMEWSKTNVTSTFHICWAAQAGLYYHYGIQKHAMDQKVTGIFPHHVNRTTAKLVRGFDDVFYAPHSRHTEVRRADIAAVPELEILAESEEAGVYLIFTKAGKQIFVMGHPEYDRLTLHKEYQRDLKKGMDIVMPKHYYPNDDSTKKPLMKWRSHANLLYCNWLNYFVYQLTPYNLNDIQ